MVSPAVSAIAAEQLPLFSAVVENGAVFIQGDAVSSSPTQETMFHKTPTFSFVQEVPRVEISMPDRARGRTQPHSPLANVSVDGIN